MALARILTAVILVTVWTEAALQQPPRDGRPPLRSAEQALTEAHDHYTAQQWREAVDKYEEAIGRNPNLVSAYFYLANSYDRLYVAARRSDQHDDAYIQAAVRYYCMAAERDPSAAVRKLALEYLAAAYGPDKLGNAAAAEAVAQQLKLGASHRR
jgi:tetratricopeptide (TPR) repeat protein